MLNRLASPLNSEGYPLIAMDIDIIQQGITCLAVIT